MTPEEKKLADEKFEYDNFWTESSERDKGLRAVRLAAMGLPANAQIPSSESLMAHLVAHPGDAPPSVLEYLATVDMTLRPPPRPAIYGPMVPKVRPPIPVFAEALPGAVSSDAPADPQVAVPEAHQEALHVLAEATTVPSLPADHVPLLADAPADPAPAFLRAPLPEVAPAVEVDEEEAECPSTPKTPIYEDEEYEEERPLPQVDPQVPVSAPPVLEEEEEAECPRTPQTPIFDEEEEEEEEDELTEAVPEEAEVIVPDSDPEDEEEEEPITPYGEDLNESDNDASDSDDEEATKAPVTEVPAVEDEGDESDDSQVERDIAWCATHSYGPVPGREKEDSAPDEDDECERWSDAEDATAEETPSMVRKRKNLERKQRKNGKMPAKKKQRTTSPARPVVGGDIVALSFSKRREGKEFQVFYDSGAKLLCDDDTVTTLGIESEYIEKARTSNGKVVIHGAVTRATAKKSVDFGLPTLNQHGLWQSKGGFCCQNAFRNLFADLPLKVLKRMAELGPKTNVGQVADRFQHKQVRAMTAIEEDLNSPNLLVIRTGAHCFSVDTKKGLILDTDPEHPIPLHFTANNMFLLVGTVGISQMYKIIYPE